MDTNTLTAEQISWAQYIVDDVVKIHAVPGTSALADKQVAQIVRAIKATPSQVLAGNVLSVGVCSTQWAVGLKRS